MRRDNGPEYQGDGIANGVALTADELINQAGQLIVVEVFNGGPDAILIGDALAVVFPFAAPTGLGAGLGIMRNVEKLDVSDANFEYIAGGALEGIAVGAKGKMIVKGAQALANVADAVTSGMLLSGGAADGRLAQQAGAYAATTAPPAALALTDGTAGNTATVYWLNPLQY